MSKTWSTRPVRPSSKWWEWPQRLSLEAPLVAVLWLAALARVHDLRLMPEVYAGLGLVVWGIYLVDRTMDARKWDPDVPWTARHSFCVRYRMWLGWLGLPVLMATLAWLAMYRLPELLVKHCLMVGGLVVGYLVWQILASRGANSAEREVSKALVAAALFALGVCAGVYTHENRYPDWAVVAGQSLLTGLFAVNLMGLTIVERESRGSVEGGLLSHAYGLVGFLTGAGVLMVRLPVMEEVRPLRLLALAVLGGIAMMVVIHQNRSRLSAIAYRCWVDAALVAAGGLLWVLG
jgi:hypothetical protein